jgi:hypothetical protein
MTRTQGEHGKDWIMTESLRVLETYGSDQITLRQLYYRLVSVGLKNCLQSYKRVVAIMGEARRSGEVPYEAFEDRDRAMVGQTEAEVKTLSEEIETTKSQIQAWLSNYGLNRWSNQPYFVEVWIEKKALQGVLQELTWTDRIGLFACKGYPSLSALSEASKRFEEAVERGQKPVIIYMGDYDPTGEDIPRAIQDSLLNDFGVEIELVRIALTEEQVKFYKLPPAPVKDTDSRSASWDGLGQVELDALEPSLLKRLAKESIKKYWSEDKYRELKHIQSEERQAYQKALKEYVISGKLETDMQE